jgi:hypothetical protein
MLPAGVTPFQLNWPFIIVIGACHVAAVFGWSGLIVVKLGTHLCGLSGINLLLPSAIAA